MEAKLQKVVADLFEVPHDQITDAAGPRTISGWDSIRHVELILACEQEFDIYFTPTELPLLSSVGGIRNVIQSKL